jgi:hypothetical protein
MASINNLLLLRIRSLLPHAIAAVRKPAISLSVSEINLCGIETGLLSIN